MRDTGPILVPLDGSELAEGALPYATALASALGAKIVLLSAWEGTERDMDATFPSMAAEIEQKANAHFGGYLDGIRKRAGNGADTIVRAGEPGDVILDVAREIEARAIVIATHGRSGVGRWLYGSTASHVLRHSDVPVLAVGPHVLEHPKTDVSMKHILVPLDGSALSEAALAPATELAKALGARISIVRAINWAAEAYPYTLPEVYAPQLDQELEAGAKAYVRRMQSSVQGVASDAFIVRAAAAAGLMDFVDKERIDLVVMTTHARGGLARAALGSVADRMLQGSAPVLLIRPAVEPGA